MDVTSSEVTEKRLSVFAAVSVSDDTFTNCTSQLPLFDRLSADVKVNYECCSRLTVFKVSVGYTCFVVNTKTSVLSVTDQQEAAESSQTLPAWSSQQSADFLVSMRYLMDLLHKHQQSGQRCVCVCVRERVCV